MKNNLCEFKQFSITLTKLLPVLNSIAISTECLTTDDIVVLPMSVAFHQISQEEAIVIVNNLPAQIIFKSFT